MEWNRPAETLYGWCRCEAVGRNIVDVTPAEISRESAAAIMKTLGAGEIWSGEFPVRTRGGETFVASVTDVPVVDDGAVVGVVGVSARANGPASLRSSVVRFAAGCDVVWHDRVHLRIGYGSASVPVSEPHLLQLLSLIAMRYTAALDEGAPLHIDIGPAEDSLLAGFGLPPVPLAYVHIGHESRAGATLLRDEISSARPSNFAATLTRLLGGWLFAADGGETHLLVPVEA